MIKNTFFYWILISLFACGEGHQADEVHIFHGETMGTYYQISYVGQWQENLQAGVDSLLNAINREVSTYDPNSLISRFNQSSYGITLESAPHFKANLEAAGIVYEKTQGAFDATVMPLVNFWGFGYTEDRQGRRIDTAEVDRIRQWVGFDQLKSSGDSLLKDRPEIQLDFSACAKGYGVDAIALYLERKGFNNYLVDIGGESRAKGKKPDGNIWRVGINVPDEEAAVQDIITAFSLSNRSVATSGNYRNWYEVEGVKYSHTINPKTGYPERTQLLSVSVFHQNCMMADAYATACMVLGIEKALSLADSSPEIDLYLIFSRPDGTMETRFTAGLDDLFNQ